jgi:dTDP-4-dehydrorhamnose reductase
LAKTLDSLVIFGGTGQIGTELRRVFSDRRTVAPSHAEISFEDEAAVASILDREHPDLVINATAYHQLDQCERNPQIAFAVNVLAVGSVAKACAQRGIRFAHIGTDYVFSGFEGRPYTEDDRECPLNVYGVSKLAGERYAMNANPQTVVFRVSGVFGRSGYSNKGPSFVERMISLAEKGEPIRVVDNIFFSPTYAPHAAATMRAVLENETSGLFHVTNAGMCSWYDLALEAVNAAGYRADVQRTTYSNDDSAIKRPLCSALAHAELHRRGYASPPPWQSGVAAYVAERRSRAAAATSG